MDNNTACTLALFIFFGWIPLLGLGAAIAMIVEACKHK